VDFEHWRGDEVDAKTRNGSIKLAYYDPLELTQCEGTGSFGCSKQ
jgi:hypothetical protein